MNRIMSWVGTLALAGMLMLAADTVAEAQKKIAGQQFDEGISMLEAAAKKSPSDKGITSALAGAHLKYGDFYMYNEQMMPFQKYPNALRQYRKVLVYDAANADAKKKIAVIENIYKSMGRPVPQ
jgi:tetratricopeptide (TPR) repeat protein